MYYWWMEIMDEIKNTVIYGYGLTVYDTSGRFSIDKNTESVELIKLADGDNEGFFAYFVGHIKNTLPKAGYPKVRCIAT